MRRLAVFALLAGCGSSTDFAEFPDALLDARCAYLERCGLVASSSDCLAYYDHLAIDNPSPQAAYDAGKLLYHPDSAQACLDAFASLSCDATEQSPDDLEVCNNVITGVVGIGGACGFDNECASDTCDIPVCMMACCTGMCAEPRALPPVGEPCTALCADDAFCGADNICHAPLPQGAACNLSEPCDLGLYCKGATSTTAGSCSPLPHIGEACEIACAEVGATCYAGTCVEYAVLGDACTVDAQCSYFYQCSNMQCSVLPTRGMPCVATCSDESWCNNATCEAQKENGSACLRNDECLTHYCARIGTGGTCADVPLCI